MGYSEDIKSQSDKRKADKRTKYKDGEIQEVIQSARFNAFPECKAGHAMVAQAMIAYNRMIDERWEE